MAKSILDSFQQTNPGIGLPSAPAEIQVHLQAAVDDLNRAGVLKGTATVFDSGALSSTAAKALAIQLIDAGSALLKV